MKVSTNILSPFFLLELKLYFATIEVLKWPLQQLQSFAYYFRWNLFKDSEETIHSTELNDASYESQADYTHAILSFPHSFLAVNHHNIKNWVPSILTHNLCLIFTGMKQFFFEKKNSKWPTQKKFIFQNRQFSKFFRENFSDWSLG